MAQILRQVLSDLSSDINALNIDDRKSFRFLASKFRDKIQVFIRQDMRAREMLRESNIWKPIRYVDLELIDAIDCCIGDTEDLTISRSKIKIPEAYSTTYGNLIKVFTLDEQQEYKEIKGYQYKEQQAREYGNGKYFWLENGYLFIPATTIKKVKVLIVAKNPLEVDIINKDKSPCTSPLDAELNYPAYLITVAKQEVLKELAGITTKVVPDEKPNENENEKS